MKTTPSLGIDMAQRAFVAALWLGEQRFAKAEFANERRGFQKLLRWLQQHGVGLVRVGVESTSVYAEALVEFLHAAGHRVYLLNPEQTACYARALGQRNKTDPADAVTIARFILAHEVTPWSPLPAEHKTLRSLTRVRHQLVETSTALSLQLRTAAPVARPYLQSCLKQIRAQIAQILKAIGKHLRLYPALGEAIRRCMTLKGVGLITAATSVAEMPPITRQTDPRTICAWAGLTPRRWQSGTFVGPARLSKKGNVYLRNALYMPALVAKRYNPLLRAFAQRLAAAGKTHEAILGALSHKMLRILVGLLKSQTDFDPNWSPKKT